MPPRKRLELTGNRAQIVTRPDGEHEYRSVHSDYPEHDKLHPSSRFNVIYDFFDYLTELGWTDLKWEEVQELVLTWQGVDVAAYHAESAKMKVDFKHLWAQFGLPIDDAPKPGVRIARPKLVEEPQVPQVPEREQDNARSVLLAKLRGQR